MIHELFAEQARRTPEAVALEFHDQQLRFGQLERRANHLASRLTPGSLVGVCLERSPEMVIAMLGILKAGAAYVPLDPHYPPDRLQFMLEEVNGPVLTRPGLLERLPFLRPQARFLEAGEIEQAPEAPPSELAYVLFTSGSTGRPKGVMGPHRAMINRFRWMWEQFPFRPDEVGLAKTSPNFVDSIWELFGPLLQGVKVVLAPEAVAADAQALTDLICERGVSRLVVVPSLLSVLVQAWSQPGCRLPRLLLTSSGEPLTGRLARQVLELDQPITLLNLYGSSEVAADATYLQVTPEHLELPIVSIGRPISHMTVELRDPQGAPVAPGQTGEMYVGGPGLALGYYNRPDLTAEKFQAGLFKTGDLARALPDGSLEYMGRVDFQVKIRGMRIEPGEIEAVARRCPGVEDCLVVARDQKLVAYYTGTTDPLPALKAALPEYMVPSLLMRLEAMPLTPNGKLDRKALPAPVWEQAEYQAPETPAEEALAQVWARVLGLERVGRADDFFALGGDSIQILRVAIEARQAGLEVTPALIAQHPQLVDLAAAAAAAGPSQAEQGLVQGSPPLTPMQQYYLSWATADPGWFNNAVLFRASRRLDPDRLKQALEAMVRHHDSLRLRFENGPQGWSQRYSVDPEVFQPPLHQFDLNGADPVARIREVCTQLQGDLDIEHGPVMQWALFRGHPDGHDRLLVAMHHLTHDGTSMQFLFEDLDRAYQGQPLPPKTTSFGKWAEALTAYARGPELARQWDSWLAVPAQATPFPVDSQRAGATQADIAMHLQPMLSAEELSRVAQRFGRGYQKQLVDGLLTGLMEVAHRRTGQRDLLLHRVGHGREACVPGVDVSRTTGWLVTHTPMQLHLGQPPQAQPDNGIGHGALRYLSQDPRAEQLAAHDQVRTLFNFEGDLWESAYYTELFAAGDPELLLLPANVAPDNPADYWFYVVGLIQNGALQVEIFYSTLNYEQATVVELAAQLRDELRRQVLEPAVTSRL